jgi:predicted AlkP superfamily phosphohydrolase/phosphomutase
MKTIIIGLDAFDPKFFEQLHSQGKTPHLSKYIQSNGYSRFKISNPPQSEVSWTSIATGQNPGGHGLFDFVHRNPKNYGIHVSLLPTKKSLVGLQFAPPHQAQTIFDYAVDHGYPATSLWWPATFPARLTSPVQTIPGLGTPDITGKLGLGTLYSVDELTERVPQKTQLERLSPTGQNGKFAGILRGPIRKKGNKTEETHLEFTLEFSDEKTAKFSLGNKVVLNLQVGEWSPVFETGFKMSMLISLKTVTRVILTQGKKNPQLYFLPLQIHPLSSAWPYGSPRNFIKNTWDQAGPFLTLGWPQDTTGLDEGIINDHQFLQLCDSILETREKVFTSQLQRFQKGILGIVFDTLDRVQHMFWRDRPEIIESWYLKLDALIGRIEQQIRASNHEDAQILILSDHGFANFDYKVNLNKWLFDEKFLSIQQHAATPGLDHADWTNTQAYAVGLNSLYLNKSGREGQGIVTPNEQQAVMEKITNQLLSWKGPDGKNVVSAVLTNQEAFEGPFSRLGPDLVIGYAPGYRASADTGIGKWNNEVIETNLDHWNADHCIDPEAVQGVLFRNRDLSKFPNPSYKDIPPMVVGTDLEPAKPPKDDDFTDEEREAVEERLKGLGYL